MNQEIARPYPAWPELPAGLTVYYAPTQEPRYLRIGFGQGDSSLGELVALVRDQQDQIAWLNDERMELYGRLGFLQARVQGLEQEIRLLKAPPAPESAPDPSTAERPTIQPQRQRPVGRTRSKTGPIRPHRRPQ